MALLKTARDFKSFGCGDERINDLDWRFAVNFGTHRDADTVLRSNFRVMLATLAALDPDEEGHGVLHASHWAVGWYDHLIVDWRRVDLVAAISEAEDSLESHPLLSDDDHSMLEMEDHDNDACGYGCSICEMNDHVNANCDEDDCDVCDEEEEEADNV